MFRCHPFGSSAAFVLSVLVFIGVCRGSAPSTGPVTNSPSLDKSRLMQLSQLGEQDLVKSLDAMEPRVRVQYLLALAQLSAQKGDMRGAGAYVRAAGEIVGKSGDEDLDAQVLLVSAGYHDAMGRVQTALDATARAAALLEKIGDTPRLQQALAYQGSLEYRRGIYPDSLKTYRRLLALADRAKDDALRAHCLSEISLIRGRMGDVDGAADGAREALRIHDKMGNTRGMADCLKTLGNLSTNATESARYYMDALAKYEEVNDAHGQANCNYNLGINLQGSGHFDDAVIRLNDAIAFYTRSSSVVGVGIAHMELGRTYHLMKDLGKAEASLVTACSLLAKGQDLMRLAQAESYLGDVLVATGRSEAARTHYATAVSNYEQAKMPDAARRIRALIESLPAPSP